MTTPTEKPYFTDALLGKLDASMPGAVPRFRRDLDAASALVELAHTAHPRVYVALEKLVRAELAGARRAREHARAVIAEYAPTTDLESYDVGRVDAARQILEAFDGE